MKPTKFELTKLLDEMLVQHDSNLSLMKDVNFYSKNQDSLKEISTLDGQLLQRIAEYRDLIKNYDNSTSTLLWTKGK